MTFACRIILKLMHKQDGLMEKSDIYKLFALGLVAVFVIEMVALGALNTGSRPQGGDQQGDVLDLTGNVEDNITIVRYEPYLIVSGNASAVDEVKQRLTASGEITYAIAAGESLIVNLNSSKAALPAAAEFEKVNATVLANAVIATSDKIRIQGNGLTTEAQGNTFKWQIRPIYPEGSKVPARFVARAQGGVMVGAGSLVLLPEFVSGAFVEAGIESALPELAQIEVEWANRSAAQLLARNAGASYKEKSFINILQNATQAQLDSIRAYDYATAVQSGLVSVKNEFGNEGRAMADLALLKLQPSFPASIAYFENSSQNQSENLTAMLLSEMQSAGINAVLVAKTRLRVRLPATIESGGKEYFTGGRVLDVETGTLAQNATRLNITLDFESAGSSITRIVSARQAAPNGTTSAQASIQGIASSIQANTSSGASGIASSNGSLAPNASNNGIG